MRLGNYVAVNLIEHFTHYKMIIIRSPDVFVTV